MEDNNNQLDQPLNIHEQKTFHKITFEQALDEVGSANWYQLRAFIWFALQWFWTAMILMQSNFVFMDPELNCNDPAHPLTKDQCNEDYVCSQPNYIQYYHINDNSLIFYYDPPLICDKSYIYTVMSSMTYVGSLIGFFIFSWYADNKGRKKALVVSWFIATLSTVIIAVTNQNLAFGFIGLFLQGLGANPAITIHFSFLNEHSQGQFREYTSIGVQVGYAMGECFLVLAAYLIPNWRKLILFTFLVPIALLNFGALLIYESPKFLHEQNTQKGLRVLNKIAKVNKKKPLQVNVLQSVIKNNKVISYSVIDLFKYKSLRVKNICCAIVFLSIQMVYYGITFAITSVGFNIYINSIIIGVCELVSYSITSKKLKINYFQNKINLDYFIPSIRRKLISLIGLIMVTVLSFSFIFLKIPDDCDGDKFCYQKIVQITIAGIMRFVICFVWTVVYIYIAELFPSAVRNLALGFSSALGTVGSSCAPYIKLVCQKLSFSPMVPLGVIGIAGIVCLFPLKETKGEKLMDQIEELNLEGEDLFAVEREDQKKED